MQLAAEPIDVDLVDGILRTYAEKGVFKGYARMKHSPSAAHYRISWFYSRPMDVYLDRKRQSISLPDFLPSIDLEPALAPNLRSFLRGMSDLPEHRRLDERRGQLSLRRKGSALTLAVRSLDGDLDYACRKLVHIANEVLLVFLSSHLYDQYKIDGLGVDPEVIWG
jgi:hypothetical protein